MARTLGNDVAPRRGDPSSEEGSHLFGEQEFFGESLCMKKIYEQIHQAASTDLPVLLLGETGTGKELVARAMHVHSDRRNLSIPGRFQRNRYRADRMSGGRSLRAIDRPRLERVCHVLASSELAYVPWQDHPRRGR